ncbi:hypothetical protein B0T26DRAFT_697353 [Lasiosphaeria miniovina]|uniref:Secreted protein n=1 Tax=Lasiosphaeria miniovina TaxID=1954250 RepID=A0AA40E5X1_9PEZI|nr:uncharacterized protein B0T26DRAFT_697353 [Lasiosphaeria miniovina]KAK0728240.1 hypothetical protein B0T26DRAFT_697353 [Lasiosphaeria miniovina]
MMCSRQAPLAWAGLLAWRRLGLSFPIRVSPLALALARSPPITSPLLLPPCDDPPMTWRLGPFGCRWGHVQQPAISE